MKIAVLSDIHESIYALQTVVKGIKVLKVDSAVCLIYQVKTRSHPQTDPSNKNFPHTYPIINKLER